MKRNGYIAMGVVVLAWGVVAIVVGSPSLNLSSGSGRSSMQLSPSCLLDATGRSARLPGTGVDVSPAPETDTANPGSQISFLGVPAAQVSQVSVAGQRSGNHPGRLAAYSQGDGASFVPDSPFRPGERVTVHASIDTAGAARRVAFSFRVDTPYSTAATGAFPNAQAAAADLQSFYTLPGAAAPVLTVTVPDHDPAAGDILTTNGPGPGQYGPLIYSPQGRLIWFERLPAGETAEDLSEQTYEGQHDLTWWKGRVLSLGFGQGEDLIMNSRYQTVARVPGGNGLHADLHDFQITPHDVAYITAFNPIRCNLTSVKGSADGTITDTAIQEIDLKTGLVRWEWHSLDHVGAGESEVQAPSGPEPWDYFHINSIDPEPSGDLLISARSTWAGYQLQAGSGQVLWRLGGNRSSFRMGPGTRTAWQHDGRMLADGEVTFFDDGSNPPIHKQSRVVRIRLNLGTHEATLTRALTHSDPPLLSASQGNAQTLADGNTVVGFGAVPEITEFAPNGSVLFDAHQSFDLTFYRAYRFPWSGQPASPPAVLASLNNTGEETIVHASWNGATDVSSWRVLAGNSARALTAQATFPVEGFESSTTLPVKYRYTAVQALSSSGAVTGRSQTVKVISYAAALAGSVRSR